MFRGLARRLPLPLFLLASAAWLGCGSQSRDAATLQKWTTGFWFWEGSSTVLGQLAEPVDALYCQVGSISASLGRPWTAYGRLPEKLPAAREYWLVFRVDESGIPGPEAAPSLAQIVTDAKDEARRRGLTVAGIQLDVDSPTAALDAYAAFLREVKKAVGPNVRVSITALLDWFRPGTAVAGVIQAVDEFVPQFYDVRNRMFGEQNSIAARIDAARWTPLFNQYRKPFRIGISTFGRSRLVPKENARKTGYLRAVSYSDLTPLDLGTEPGFQLQTSRTAEGELVLTYRATRDIRIGYGEFRTGERVEFILPTPDAVQAAVKQAKLMDGYCAGVVFFRWPAFNETLALQPADVLAMAGAASNQSARRAELRVVDGHCATVYCADLYLLNARLLSPEPDTYSISTETELEYFMPGERMPVRMAGPSRLEVVLPPYSGRSRLRLGRAVASRRTGFTLEEKR